MFKMEFEYIDGILLVKLKGILDRRQSYKINNYLNPIIKKHSIKYLIYNATNLKGIDNAGIDALINSKCYIKNNKGIVKVYGLNDKLKKIFKTIRISTISENRLNQILEMI